MTRTSQESSAGRRGRGCPCGCPRVVQCSKDVGVERREDRAGREAGRRRGASRAPAAGVTAGRRPSEQGDRSPRSSASSTSWVTKTTVRRCRARCRRAVLHAGAGLRRRARRTARPSGPPGRAGEGAGQLDALPLPPESWRGQPVGVPGEADPLQPVARLAPSLLARLDRAMASGSSTLARTVRHGSSASSWKTRARSAAGRGRPRAVGEDLAASGRQQPGEGAQQRGLAAAGRAEDDQDLARAARRGDSPSTTGVAGVADRRARRRGPGGGPAATDGVRWRVMLAPLRRQPAGDAPAEQLDRRGGERSRARRS